MISADSGVSIQVESRRVYVRTIVCLSGDPTVFNFVNMSVYATPDK